MKQRRAASFVDKFLSESGDKISEDEKTTLKDAANQAKEKLAKAESVDEVKELTEELAKVTNPIFTKLYQQGQEAGDNAQGGAADGESTIDIDPNDIN